MKINIKARITCLFISKTTIMVINVEKIYFVISISDKRLSSLLIYFILSFFVSSFLFFPYLFRFNFVVSEQNQSILFCLHIWAEPSFLFWTFLSGTFFRWGGCMCTRCTPPVYAPELYTNVLIETKYLCCLVYLYMFQNSIPL